MIWLLQLYPPAWRQRYGEEVAKHLASETVTLRMALDLIAGAIDARLNPQWLPTSTASGGQTRMSTIFSSCQSSSISQADQKRSAAWMVGTSLVLAVLATALPKSLFQQALLYAAFPMALLVSAKFVYLKTYSRPARMIILTMALTAMYGFFVAVTFLSDRI